MTKARKYRLLIAIAAAIITYIVPLMLDQLPSGIPVVQCNVFFDTTINAIQKKITKNTYGSVESISSPENTAQIVISTNRNTKLETTNKRSAEIGYSPIVALFPSELTSKSDVDAKFIKTGNAQGYSYYTYDISKIYNGVLAGSGVINLNEQLGLSKGYDKVKLGLPDISYSFRRDVIDSIVYTLLDGKPVESLTDSEWDDIKITINYLQRKSESITTNTIAENKKEYIIIVPEYLLANLGSYGFSPFYSKETFAVSVKAYTNMEKGEDNSVDYFEKYVNDLRTDRYIFRDSYIRNYAAEPKYGDGKAHYADNKLKVTILPDNSSYLESKLGVKYWEIEPVQSNDTD